MVNLTDIELVNKVLNESNNDAFNEICRRYGDIFYKICVKYSYKLSEIGVCPQDIYDEKVNTIYSCVQNFNPSKGMKLGTWIGCHARFLCLHALQKMDRERKTICPNSYDDVIKTHSSESFTLKDNINFSKINEIIKDKRIFNIFKMRYDDTRDTWKNIGRKMGMSTQSVINLHEKGIKILRKNKKFFE